MRMHIVEARHQVLAARVDDAGVAGYTVGTGRPDADDPVTGNGHILVGLQRAVARADHGHAADDQVYGRLGWLMCLHHRDGTAPAGQPSAGSGGACVDK